MRAENEHESIGKSDGLSGYGLRSSEEGLIAHRALRNRSGYLLIALVGGPLIAAACLLFQLHKLPDSSLSYSLLNAIISLLFNFSSSALLKVFSFLISLLGFSKGFTPSAR